MVRIICVGNSFFAPDAIGPAVYAELAKRPLPDGVELLLGGLGGLDLLRWFEDCRRVILVDRIAGFGDPGSVLVLREDRFTDICAGSYGHSGGLAYLLGVLPHLKLDICPEVILVGHEGDPVDHGIRQAAKMALQLALQPVEAV